MKEKVIHNIWQQLNFDVSCVDNQIERGLSILQPGTLNFGDGPDFSGANIRLDGLLFFGDVEIHIHPGDWYTHGHHLDERYNRVILHVCYENNGHSKPIIRQDGTEIPQIFLKPLLQEPVHTFVNTFESKGLACGGNIRYLNTEVLERHIEKMHSEYFDFKTEQVLQVYPAHLSVQKAWMFLIQKFIFEGLGFSSNTEAMRRLYLIVESRGGIITLSPKELLEVAGLGIDCKKSDNMHRGEWDFSGCRPPNQPSVRIVQAWYLARKFEEKGWRYFINCNPGQTWNEIILEIPKKYRPGRKRLEQLFTVVYLPCLYVLGILSGHKTLCSKSRSSWMDFSGSQPESVMRAFINSHWPENLLQKSGVTHLYKRYCSQHRCTECDVLKAVISS